MQVNLLRSWVTDLVGQNTLLARTVEELEIDVTSRLLYERRKQAEVSFNIITILDAKISSFEIVTLVNAYTFLFYFSLYRPIQITYADRFDLTIEFYEFSKYMFILRKVY